MAGMPRFVLLYHDCPPTYERESHWDFMLEAGGVLRTWALERLPCEWRVAHARTSAVHRDCPVIADGNAVTALQLGDHRVAYLELEGTLSGDRGSVARVATGSYVAGSDLPDKLEVVLAGGDIVARVTMSRNERAGGAMWTLAFERSA